MVVVLNNLNPGRSGLLLDGRQPERHVLARRRHHHVLGVELDAADGAGVIAVQDADLGAVLGVPDVDTAVRRARDDELRVWKTTINKQLAVTGLTALLPGENEASRGRLLELRCPVKVCRTAPLKASISLMREPLVDTRMVLPSGLNFSPVHSMSFSTGNTKRQNLAA